MLSVSSVLWESTVGEVVVEVGAIMLSIDEIIQTVSLVANDD